LLNTEKYPQLVRLHNAIRQKDPFQSKHLSRLWQGKDETYFNEAEAILGTFVEYMTSVATDYEYLVTSYLDMCKSILTEQIRFKRTGDYRYNEMNTVIKEVYSNAEFMKRYMIGVAISEAIWENHFVMYNFYKHSISEGVHPPTYLEIGVGHGLFLLHALRQEGLTEVVGVDISETSIALTKGLLEFSGVDFGNLRLIHEEVMATKFSSQGNFGFITMGEVLEHVEQPLNLLTRIKELLHLKGRAYISTCTNAPVVDHIYLFRNVEEIRSMISAAGLSIKEETIIANDGTPETMWEKESANLSYAAIVKVRGA